MPFAPLTLLGFLAILVAAFAVGIGWTFGAWLVNRLLR